MAGLDLFRKGKEILLPFSFALLLNVSSCLPNKEITSNSERYRKELINILDEGPKAELEGRVIKTVPHESSNYGITSYEIILPMGAENFEEVARALLENSLLVFSKETVRAHFNDIKNILVEENLDKLPPFPPETKLNFKFRTISYSYR